MTLEDFPVIKKHTLVECPACSWRDVPKPAVTYLQFAVNCGFDTAEEHRLLNQQKEDFLWNPAFYS
jgi:hypothetical protein